MPGMHQSMQSGSMARALAAPPMSAVSQPKRSRMAVASAFAPASLPPMNIVGFVPPKSGLTMCALPTHDQALTKWAWGACCCRRSIRDSLGPVKNLSTPSSGGSSVMGLVASSTVLPARCATPASAIADSAALPFTASTMISPQAAASANVPTAAFAPAFAFQSASFEGSREPRMAAKPCFKKPSASTSPT